MPVQKKVINAVKIAKGRTLQVNLKEYHEDGTFRDVSIKCDQLYDKDMETALNKLKPHLVHACDLYEKDTIIDINDFESEVLEKITIQSVSISGSEDSEGVVISGVKKIGEKDFMLTSPCTEVDGEYPYGSELAELIESIRFEAGEYLFNGKYAIQQKEIEFPEDKDQFQIDKEASEVAKGVLGNIADRIEVTVSSKRGKGKKASLSIVSDTVDAQIV